MQSCSGASLLLASPPLLKIALADSIRPSSAAAVPQFHLSPKYRSPLPLEAVFAKIPAGSDEFVSEKYAEELEEVLANWTSELRKSASAGQAVQTMLADDFVGTSFAPHASHPLRSGMIDIWRNSYSDNLLERDAFIHELRSSLAGLSQIITAEFQITGIQVALPKIQTRVRFDLVGSGAGFYREQRTGYWDLEWTAPSSGQFRLKTWKVIDESRSRSKERIFEDVAGSAFIGATSFKEQLLHGSDYWRTILDGASGIDVYGHNGISVGDIDNDGFDDLYVCQPAGLPNRLYRNRGDGTFEDITDASGVGLLDNTSCALFADIDNDGMQDLIVVRTGGPVLFRNQGNGKFREQPQAFKFATPPQGTFTGAALADYDRDGWLDIYFCLYTFYQGTDQYRYPLPYFDANNGPPNFMMRNNRDGTFSDVTQATGLNQNNTRYSFCCGWNDYNRDGWPDLYVVNDFGRKNLYRNNGDGTFTDVAAESGAEDVGAGMSVCWLDFDNDGAQDLYVGNMWTAAGERISTLTNFKSSSPEDVRALYQKHAMGNSLLRNNSGKFQDVTSSAGTAIGRWAWSSDAWDFDHDGFSDLYIANGMVSGPSKVDLNSFFWRQTVANSPDQAKPLHDYEQGWNAINELIRSDGTWSGYERNVFYANNGDGTFSDISGSAGTDFIEDGRSFALADFDHDGRQEVFVKNRNAPQLRLLKNVLAKLPASISFRLKGTKSNRDAIGAVITLTAGDLRQTRSVQAGSGFLCQHSKEIFFGLGNGAGPIKASIRWPSGLVQDIGDLPSNHTVLVEEGSAVTRSEPFRITQPARRSAEATVSGADMLPETVQTWLLSPISAPEFTLPDKDGTSQSLSSARGNPLLLNFWTSESAACRETLRAFERLHRTWSQAGVRLLTINVDEAKGSVSQASRDLKFSFPILRASDDVSAIYNILYRYLFDRHRDMPLPTTFLINSEGEIVKVYQGSVDLSHIADDFHRIPGTDAERLSRALPFRGITQATEFSRNYLSYGSVYFQRGYLDQAASAFERALRGDPANAEALYGLGSIYLKQDKNAEARDAFERVTKLEASYPDTLPNAWNNLGLLTAREGKIDEALPYFQRALELNPNHLVALENLGNAYRQQKKWQEARQILERAVAVGPEDAEANYSLGMVFAQLGDDQQAYDYLQRALKFRPDYPEALNNLGVLYMRSNRREDATANFQQCIRVAPAFDQSYLNLARVYVIEGSPEKARDVLLDLLKQHPDHAIAKNMLQQLESR